MNQPAKPADQPRTPTDAPAVPPKDKPIGAPDGADADATGVPDNGRQGAETVTKP